MLSLMENVSKKLGKPSKNYKNLLSQTLSKARETFFKGGILWDGENDSSIRPNIFLAHYIFPDLLSKKEWRTVFQNSLESLWLEWGGISTIDKKNALFCHFYTGQNNKSYHRGDSWFFVNNIAAISLHKIDPSFFREYIQKILGASLEDNLFNGFIGHSSELSSSARQDASGCWCQSWSNATLVELVQLFFS